MRSGFTIVRNGDSLGYPWTESIRSLAPLVDELVVAHGDSTDSTRATLERLGRDLPCPLVIVDSPWDPASLKGGLELSRQTNIALKACRHDVCVYLQSDELLHEADHELLRADLARFERDSEVDALALTWVHFYGTFDTVVRSKNWYRREVRVVKRSRGLKSYGDAQGFRIPVDRFDRPTEGADVVRWKKPRTALSAARCLHYGWVRPPEVMARKSETLDRLWHGSARDGQHNADNAYPILFGLESFDDVHPVLMQPRIADFEKKLPGFNPFRDQALKKDASYWRLYVSDVLERSFGWRPGEFRNYRIVKRYSDRTPRT